MSRVKASVTCPSRVLRTRLRHVSPRIVCKSVLLSFSRLRTFFIVIVLVTIFVALR